MSLGGGRGESITTEELKQAVLGYLSCNLCGSETDRMRRTFNKAKAKRSCYGKEGAVSLALSKAEGNQSSVVVLHIPRGPEP